MNPIPSNNSQTSSIDLTQPIEPCSPLVADILNVIFSQSDIKSLGNISSVSREWHVVSGKDKNWEAHKSEFNVVGPNIKEKIKASLPTIEELFNEILKEMDIRIWDPERKAFNRDLVKVLFEKENIRSIKVEILEYKKWFTVNLKEEKNIDFNNSDIFNIFVPKKVLFSVGMGEFDPELDSILVFEKEDYMKGTKEHFPIQINNKRLSMGINKCTDLYIDFDRNFVANCLYESRFLPYSNVTFITNATLLESIKK